MNQRKTKPTIMIVFNDMSLGGVQKKTLDIIKYLQQNFHYQIIVCLRYKKGMFLRQLPKDVVVIGPRFHTPKLDMLWFIFWLGHKINYYKPQTILSYMDMGSVPAITASRFLFWIKTKVVIGEDILTSKHVYTERYPSIRKKLIQILYPLSHKIIVQTPVQKKDLINIIGQKISKKVVVSPNWLSLDYPPVAKENNSRNTDILFIGRIDDQKNLPRFVHIVSMLTNDFPELRVKIVGDGARIKQVKKLVKDLGLTQTITFIPPTVHPVNFYLDSKIFLLTSDYEGFPLTLMEAISCNCYPVINSLSEIMGFFDKDTTQYIFDKPDQAVKIIKKALSGYRPPSLKYYQQKLVSLQSLHISKFTKHLTKQS